MKISIRNSGVDLDSNVRCVTMITLTVTPTPACEYDVNCTQFFTHCLSPPPENTLATGLPLEPVGNNDLQLFLQAAMKKLFKQKATQATFLFIYLL